MKYTALLTFIFCLQLFSYTGAAHEIYCNMSKLPMEQMIEESQAIAHVRVLHESAYWNEKRSMIFTYYQLEVIQTLKGELNERITLLVEGGRAEGILIDYQDRIDLQAGAEFVALLSAVPKHWECGELQDHVYAAYASKQGVFLIDSATGACSDVFKRYQSIEELTRAVVKQTRKRVPMAQPKNVPAGGGSSAVASVASFSPTTVSAGTGTLLTINGSGFGTTRGNGFVEFTIVDGSFAQPLAKDYVLWSDTQIQLYVPSLTVLNGVVKETAATGPIRITPDGGVAAVSPTSLNVKYAMFNRYNTPQDSAVTYRMINANGTGGYTFQYNNQFSTLGAGVQAALERAMSTWKCGTGVNFGISPSTTAIRAVAIDNVSVITDDVEAPLPTGILGRGISITGLCNNGPLVKAFTIEMDIIITANPSLPWNFSTAAPAFAQYDFESVLLHELGHVHQLAHTRNGSSNIMAPTISNGAMNRSLTALDLEGGLDAMARATSPAGCNIGLHIALIPTISISSSISLPACNPNAITFTATTANMTANTQLNWFKNGVNVAQGSTYTLNGPLNNDVVFCQYYACTSIRSNSITIAITNNAASISYASSYCKIVTAAQSVTRTGAAGGTYSASPAGLTINGSTGAVTPSTSTVGTYTVTYTVAASGPCPVFTTTASRTVIINSPLATPAAITGSLTAVCNSTKTYSIAAVAGASSYTWTVPAGATISGSSTGTSISVVFTGTFSSGTISVRANSSTGCNSGLRSITVSGAPAQPGSITSSTIVLGFANAAIAAVSGATSYLWTVTGASITAGQGTPQIIISGGLFSTANVCVRAVNSCGQSPQRCATVNTFQNSNGQQGMMDEEEAVADEKFVAPSIYPNPAEHILNVSFEESDVKGDVMIDILDGGGMLIHRTYYNEAHGTRIQLSLQDLPAGMYMLRMQSEKGTVQTQRFIKQ